MFLPRLTITKDSFVTDIVRQDYRTATVFKKYGIDYCCGGRWPLGTACEMRGLDFLMVKEELERATRPFRLSYAHRYEQWDIDFLTDYIVQVHHAYLRQALPAIKELLDEFAREHRDQHPGLADIEQLFAGLYRQTFPHLEEEEKIIFPYIKQIAHAYESKESYARLLVRTLRKPVENMMHHEHEWVAGFLKNLRSLTNNYTPPGQACSSHQVVFSLLKELDDELAQHLFLENEVLFPRAIAMEKELLEADGA